LLFLSLSLSSCLSPLLSLLSQRLTTICLPSSYNVVVEAGDASCVIVASKLFLPKLLLIELVAAVAAVGSCARAAATEGGGGGGGGGGLGQLPK